MTDKQQKLVNWIQSKTGVRYDPKDNLSDYINEWRPKAEDIAEEERQMRMEDRLNVDEDIRNEKI